ncbi:MAG TPA: tetratricopeptide repeat protein [Terriglobales bacterium]|nr:tetratricopeptide repeat protein [Terriglobales bacterium]
MPADGSHLSSRGERPQTIGITYDRLGAEAQKRWRCLGIFPESFDAQAAAAIWETELKAAEHTLNSLLQQGLVEWDGQANRYYLRDMMGDFARGKTPADEAYEAALQHGRHYLQVLHRAEDLYLDGGESSARGLALVDLERENIQAGQAWAAKRAALDDEAAALCSRYAAAGSHCLSQRQHARERIRWREAALAAASRLSDRSAERAHLGNLGTAYRGVGEYRRAIECYERHLQMARELNDSRSEEQDLANIGDAYECLGEFGHAIEYFEHYLQLARKLDDRRGEGNALGCIGTAYHSSGGYFRALEFHEQALAIHREIGDWRGEGVALGNLGIACYRLGQHRQAIENFGRQLEIARSANDRHGEGNALWNMSLALDELGDREKAIDYAEAALRIREDIADPNAEKVRSRLLEWRSQ